MAPLDVDADLRWFRSLRRGHLERRPDEMLPFVSHDLPGGQALMLDTCVYIDSLYDRLPEQIAGLIGLRHVNHSVCAIQELLHSVGALDPRDRRTPGVIGQIATLIRSMRPHRIFTPDAEVMARAALASGILCRLQNFGGDHRKRALTDATLFLQAQKLGFAVVTRNVGDFDLLLQLLPRATIYLYRV